MTVDDPGNTPGETIGQADRVENYREIDEVSGPKAVLFVTPGFDPSAAIDIEVVLVDTDTLAEIARKRT